MYRLPTLGDRVNMITPEHIKITINGQDFYTHACKFQELCDKKNRYNPALTIKNKYGVEHSNQCTVGGGPGCKIWCEETDKEIGWDFPKHEDRLHRTTWRPQQH
jgi:hypothetical protein